MSGQKPVQNNQARKPAPANSHEAHAEQQAREDQARDEGQNTLNRDMIRQETHASQNHPK